jgi:hypothetical protein
MKRLSIGVLTLMAMVGTLLLTASTAAAQPPLTSAFVIGDGNAAPGSAVEFWGAQWWSLNTVGGGPAPASFKGFATTVTLTGPCSGTFTTGPGNSSAPPPAVGPAIPVLVASDVTQSGAVISGTFGDIVAVQTNPGYGPSPGQAGTGSVLGSVCGGGNG